MAFLKVIIFPILHISYAFILNIEIAYSVI